MVSLSTFLLKISEIYAEHPTYREGGLARDGTCDCVGMVFAVKAEEADKLIATLEAQGEKAYRIGRVAKTGEDGERLVLL